MNARSLSRALLATLVFVAVGAAPTASADFPYTGPGGNPHDPTTWKLPPGVAPSNLGDDWKLAATSAATRSRPRPNPTRFTG